MTTYKAIEFIEANHGNRITLPAALIIGVSEVIRGEGRPNTEPHTTKLLLRWGGEVEVHGAYDMLRTAWLDAWVPVGTHVEHEHHDWTDGPGPSVCVRCGAREERDVVKCRPKGSPVFQPWVSVLGARITSITTGPLHITLLSFAEPTKDVPQ